jgi:lipoate---protein ligase
MLSKLRFARLKNVHIFEQLRLEELLLRQDNSCWCLINSGPKIPAIVTGFSGKVPELVNIEAAKRDNIGVIRRFTGGGTVVVDENTFFVSFICNVSEVNIYSWLLHIHANGDIMFIEFRYWSESIPSGHYELD